MGKIFDLKKDINNRLNGENNKNQKSIADYDDQLVLNNKQNYVVSIYMMISNVTLTIVILYVMLHYQDIFLSGMVILGIVCSGFAEKILLDATKQHDITLITIFKLREEYEKEKMEELKVREKNKDEYRKILNKNSSSLELFKREIHEAATNQKEHEDEDREEL